MAVARIAGHRVGDRGEVGADLVRAAGLEASLDEAVGRQRLEHGEVRARRARAAPTHGAALGRPGVAAERGVDRAGARAGSALDQRAVGPVGLAALDHRGQAPVRLGVAGDDQQPGGVAVEPVHDARALGLAAAEQIAERIDQGVAVVPRRRVHDQARGLVDHGEVLVDVHEPGLSAHGGDARAGAGASAASAITTTPTVIAMSATLNAGHTGGSRKSVTAPSRIRSARLPSAPPLTSPTPSHSHGRWVSKANQPRISARATG